MCVLSLNSVESGGRGGGGWGECQDDKIFPLVLKGHPLFFPPSSVVRATPIFFVLKKSYEEGNDNDGLVYQLRMVLH